MAHVLALPEAFRSVGDARSRCQPGPVVCCPPERTRAVSTVCSLFETNLVDNKRKRIPCVSLLNVNNISSTGSWGRTVGSALSASQSKREKIIEITLVESRSVHLDQGGRASPLQRQFYACSACSGRSTLAPPCYSSRNRSWQLQSQDWDAVLTFACCLQLLPGVFTLLLPLTLRVPWRGHGLAEGGRGP